MHVHGDSWHKQMCVCVCVNSSETQWMLCDGGMSLFHVYTG